MTTRTVDILGFSTKPGDNSSVYSIPLSAITGFSGDADCLVVAFDASGSEDELHLSFDVPEEYSTSAQIVLRWFSNHSAGDDVRWTVYYNPVAETEALDGTGFSSEEATGSVSGSMTLEDTAIDLPSSILQAGDHVQMILARSGDHSADTQNSTVYLSSARFSYDDS